MYDASQQFSIYLFYAVLYFLFYYSFVSFLIRFIVSNKNMELCWNFAHFDIYYMTNYFKLFSL
jgi:hypothetical protein